MTRIESNLKGGKQSSDKPRAELEYGVSITDGTLSSPGRLLSPSLPT